MIDLRHPLAVLAKRMPWDAIEASLAPVFERKARDGQTVADADLFGPTMAVAGAGVGAAGRPRLPIRLLVGLLYLKHAYNESDESVCERWAQDVYFQYFCGEEYFQACLPCSPTNLVRFGPRPADADASTQPHGTAVPTPFRCAQATATPAKLDRCKARA